MLRSRAHSILATLFVSVAPAFAADKPVLPEGPGKETTARVCGSCHAAEIVMSRRESREGWSGIVEDMIMRGMQGTDEEYGEVVDYLVAKFPRGSALPKINVNKAEAADLISGAGFTNAQAAAIVKYRDANGPFKTAEDLAKVPGINANTLQAKKARLEF